MNSDVYKGLYEAESSRRTDIESSLSTPVTALTVLGGALYYLSTGVEFINDSATWALVAALAGSLGFYTCSLYYYLRAWHGYEYQRIPTSKKLGAHYQDLLDYYATYGGQPRDAFRDFKADLD